MHAMTIIPDFTFMWKLISLLFNFTVNSSDIYCNLRPASLQMLYKSFKVMLANFQCGDIKIWFISLNEQHDYMCMASGDHLWRMYK